MKKIGMLIIIAALLSVSLLLPAHAEEARTPIYGSGASTDGESRMDAATYTLSSKFHVSEGRFVGIVLNELFTPGSLNFGEIKIYKWKQDYPATVAAGPVFTGDIEDHEYDMSNPKSAENDCVILFERAYAEGDYLAVLEAQDSMFLWTHAKLDGVECFIDEEPYESGSFKISYIYDNGVPVNEAPFASPSPSASPTPAATEKPSPAITASPVKNTASASVPPKPSEAPKTENTGLSLPVIIGISALGAVAVAVIVILSVRAYKKRRSNG